MSEVTYITYNEGQEAKHLHLGNLVHDYNHPNANDPYVEKAYTDISEPPPKWASVLQLENFAMTLGKDTRGVESDEEEEADEGPRYRVVAAAKTTKLEIEDPEEFFDDVTLASADAKKWLTSRITAAEHFPAEKRPQIWMLTGLVLMTHATWTSLSSKAHSFTAGAPAPFNPGGVSQIRKLSVSDHVKPVFGVQVSDEPKHISGAVIHETGKYPGTRGWAAQWQKVEVSIASGKESGKLGANKLLLGDSSEKVAVVKLDEDTYAKREEDEEEDDEDADDEFWEAFLDKAEEIQAANA